MSQFDINIVKGSDFLLDVVIKNNDGYVVDLSSYSGFASIRQRLGDSNYWAAFNLNFADAVSGQIALSLESYETQNLPVSQGVYDLDLSGTNGQVFKPLYGYVSIFPDTGPISSYGQATEVIVSTIGVGSSGGIVDTSNLVNLTGDQLISGSKTFTEGITIYGDSLILSGNWSTDTYPTESGDIVNKGYLDSIISGLEISGGSVDTTYLVNSTGDQIISGSKTFAEGVAIYGDSVILSGNWATDTYPVESGDIVNKGYLDSIAVFVTGNQQITGIKTFKSDIRVTRISDDEPAESNPVLNCSLRVLYDVAGNDSVHFANRQLHRTNESLAVDWQNLILSGNWITNTTPTLSGHLVNKDYADSTYVKTGTSQNNFLITGVSGVNTIESSGVIQISAEYLYSQLILSNRIFN